jgi:hypothetical protein
VSHSCACIGSPCLRHCVHGASIGGGGSSRRRPRPSARPCVAIWLAIACLAPAHATPPRPQGIALTVFDRVLIVSDRVWPFLTQAESERRAAHEVEHMASTLRQRRESKSALALKVGGGGGGGGGGSGVHSSTEASSEAMMMAAAAVPDSVEPNGGGGGGDARSRFAPGHWQDSKLRMYELKAECKRRGLPIGGSRAELAQRLGGSSSSAPGGGGGGGVAVGSGAGRAGGGMAAVRRRASVSAMHRPFFCVASRGAGRGWAGTRRGV